ncbi:MAG: hypothetical protein JSV03_11885 [Planctomycetota bacterium]|nr:MAG: hypothetical protein JSV03_11885 [Planctomycetota bacterium]
MNRSRREKKTSIRGPEIKPAHCSAPVSTHSVILLTVLTIVVAFIVLVTHLPVLSAQALLFDDNQYLTNNVLVQNPSWSSAKQFLIEVLKPSTVRGYYQPLSMISLMFDYASGGRPDNL